MFAKTIIDSDAFLDMPLSAQSLYFHVSMRADDDGFINNPKKIQRMIGASDDDFKILVGKNFIIPFESGIVVIKHWRIHNYIRQDRKHETKYLEEMELLEVKQNGAYTLSSDICQADVSQLSGSCPTEVRLGKDSIGKVNNKTYFDDEDINKAFLDYMDMRKKIKAPMTDRAIELAIKNLNKLSGGDKEKSIAILNQSIMNSWKGLFDLKDKKNKFVNCNQREYDDKSALERAFLGVQS